MNNILKPIVLGAGFAALMILADTPNTPYQLAFVQEASAVVVRRAAPVAAAAVVVGTSAAVASSSANATAAANANATAAANANAAAANANAAAAAAKQPTPGSPPPVGTIVTSLPPGCSATKLNGVDYQRCGSTYYVAKMMGNNLVFVVAQP